MALTRRTNIGVNESVAATETVIVNRPTDSLEGDLLVAVVGSSAEDPTLTCIPLDSGWGQLLAAPNEVVGLGSVFVFTKIATASETASYSFTLNGLGDANWSTICVAYEATLGVSAYIGSTGSDATGSTQTSSSITTQFNNDVVLSAFAQDQTVSDGAWAASSPGGLALLSEVWGSSNTGLGLFAEVRAAAGAGAHTVTQTTGGDNTRGSIFGIWALTPTVLNPRPAILRSALRW